MSATDAPERAQGSHPIIESVSAGRRLFRMATRSFENTRPSTQFQFLSSLDYLGEVSLMELAAWERVSAPAVTKVIVPLEREGLVARRRSVTDGRVSLVSITEAGHAELIAWHQRVQSTFAPLSADEAEALDRATQILRKHAALIDSRARGTGQAG